jgi:putative ABC transport system permease protein
MNGFWRNIRYALRGLAMTSGFKEVAALALALVIGGTITIARVARRTLCAKTALNANSIEQESQTERVATLDLALPPARKEAEKIRRVVFLNELFTRLRALPGIVEVGGSSCLPLPEYGHDGPLAPRNARQAFPIVEKRFGAFFDHQNPSGPAEYCAATAGYFRALRIPLLRGRLFNARDTFDAPHVALISESLARLEWPGQDPIGKELEFANMDGDTRLLTIVGIVGDLRANNLETTPGPTIYVNYLQRPQVAQGFTVVMRSNGEAASVFPSAFRARSGDSSGALRYE